LNCATASSQNSPLCTCTSSRQPKAHSPAAIPHVVDAGGTAHPELQQPLQLIQHIF
jgi:hypothetical protein